MLAPSSRLARPAVIMRRLSAPNGRLVGIGPGSVSRVLIGGVLPLLVGVSLDVALASARYAKRAIRDVIRDDRPGTSVRVIADAHRRDEGGIDAGFHALSDLGAALGPGIGVVVGGHVAGADVA